MNEIIIIMAVIVATLMILIFATPIYFKKRYKKCTCDAIAVLVEAADINEDLKNELSEGEKKSIYRYFVSDKPYEVIMPYMMVHNEHTIQVKYDPNKPDECKFFDRRNAFTIIIIEYTAFISFLISFLLVTAYVSF